MARYCCLQGSLVAPSSSSEAAAQLASILNTRTAIQRTKQADKAVAILAGQLYTSGNATADQHAVGVHAAGAAAVAAAAPLEVPPSSSISAYHSAPPQPVPVLSARTELLRWKQQLRQERAWQMRCWTHRATRAALHSARGRDMQVDGGSGGYQACGKHTE
jgi:hypothetical protein